MATRHIILLSILGAALLSSVLCNNGSGPDDCCLRFYPRKLHVKFIKSYYQTDYRCSKTGVVFLTTKSKICVNPNDYWVEKIMKALDEKQFERR